MIEKYLHDLGIVSNASTNQKSAQIIYKIQPTLDYFHSSTPSEYVSDFWDAYQNLEEEKTQNLNGNVFELILACTLVRYEISPFYMQATVQYVPNATFDLMIYQKENGPITLSAKTSLRERYKQADLEAMALKQVHRRAESHLITLNASEAGVQSKKIESGEIASLDSIVIATESNFDLLINRLQALELIEPEPINPIKAGRLVLPS